MRIRSPQSGYMTTSYSPFGLRPDTVVGYTFKAETLCPACTLAAVLRDLHIDTPEGRRTVEDMGWDTEALLDFFAPKCDPVVDRQDERSFDSDFFPKVIFATDLDDEPCDGCARMLIQDM
jgi:hypothetical protein